MKNYYSVFKIQVSNLEKLLNDIETEASGNYEIVSIFKIEKSQNAMLYDSVAVTVRFTIDEEFHAEEIKQKLGF